MAKKKTDTPRQSMARPPEGTAASPAWLTTLTKVWLRFRRFLGDIAGVALLALAAMTLLALIGSASGAWLTGWARFLRVWFGWGALLVVLGILLAGLGLIFQRQWTPDSRSWWRVISLEAAGFALLGLLALAGGVSLARGEAGLDGGVIGWGLARLVGLSFGEETSTTSMLVSGLIFGAVFIVGSVNGLGLVGTVFGWIEKRLNPRERRAGPSPAEEPAVSVDLMEPTAQTPVASTGTPRRKAYIPPEYRKQFKVEEAAETPSGNLALRDERLPGLDLLPVDQTHRPNERLINQTAGLLEKTLAEFGVPARVIGFQIGPTVTQFAVEPGYFERGEEEDSEARQKVRVSQIAGLQRDLALALSASRLRIQAPVPGKSYVGIEVPNDRAALVRLRPILESETFQRLASPLAVALGRDVSGQPLVADLARMPHLLIAGTTGSGKSICIAALTVCLAMNNTPADLRLVMVDPKMVELVRFNGLPHLLGKVETNLERIGGVLRWVVAEMERRYKLLEELRARDLESYNRKAGRRKEYQPLPRIVVIIDELADLMMNSAESTEATLVRLAQMARATGIHLVVATQRPSTDVVTGIIKANFPARMSFAVASSIDSRVILDMVGAESLLGRGDMLFLPPEVGSPIRSQGVMVTDQEVEKVITYWQSNWEAGTEESPWERMLHDEAFLADRDDLVEKAIAVVRETGRASASMFQRRLRIGYPRAARLVDELEELGIVGPPLGGGREREVMPEWLEGEDGETAPEDDDLE